MTHNDFVGETSQQPGYPFSSQLGGFWLSTDYNSVLRFPSGYCPSECHQANTIRLTPVDSAFELEIQLEFELEFELEIVSISSSFEVLTCARASY